MSSSKKPSISDKYMNIAIIGSNGFIGKHLTQTLVKNKEHTIFLFGKNTTSFFKDVYPYSTLNFRDLSQIDKQFSNIDLVYYLASESIPSSTWDKPLQEIEMNLLPFIQFMESICHLNVKKVALVSSAGTVYGPSSEKVKEDSPKNPFSPYGITKLTMEHYLSYYKVKYGIHSDIYRVSNVYGFGQNTSKGLGIINTFLEQILMNGAIRIFGNGEITRNFVYINDVADLLALSASSNLSSSNVYNLSSDDTLNLNDLVKVMKSVVEEKFEVEYTPIRESDNPKIELDNSKIKKAMPTYQFTSIAEGIAQTYQHLKSHILNNK